MFRSERTALNHICDGLPTCLPAKYLHASSTLLNMSNSRAYLRRSVLYVPAANTRAMDKSWSLGADAIVFDLEDAVAPSAKAAARAALITQLADNRRVGIEVVIRVNALGTADLALDLEAVAQSQRSTVRTPCTLSRSAPRPRRCRQTCFCGPWWRPPPGSPNWTRL